MSLKRKTVLFLVPSLLGGGAERVFSTILRHLDRLRFEPHLGVLQAAGPYVQDVPKDVVVHNLRISRVRWALPAIVRLVWSLRPHAVISTQPHLNLALTLVRVFLPRRTRVLIQEVSTASVAVRREAHPRILKWLYRRLYKRADQVVCLSDAMMDDLAINFGLPREKMVRIYNPVDLQRMQGAANIGENPYDNSGPNIVAAGRLSWEKGFDVLLNAMPAVIKRLPGARLIILGEGPLHADLTKQALRLGINEAICCLGFQQDPWRYFKFADVFVLSSRFEGLPNVLLEALALGTPAIATNCTGAMREIEACGTGMVLVPPEDPPALAEAIVSVCQKGSRQHLATPPTLHKFDLQQIVGEYSELLLS